MKRFFAIAWCVLSLAVRVEAKELSVAGVLSDAETYAGKAVVVKGDFLYGEPVRESFTIGEGRSTIEVFYRNLPGSDKLFISQQKNVKTAVVVWGRFTQYANMQHSYFIDAVSLKFEGASSPSPVAAPAVSFFDIQSDPAKYVSKPVTMKGLFLYSEPMRQSFTFEQNGKPIEVIVSDLPKIDRERILGLKKDSKTPVTVSGLLQKYGNDEKRFFITAYTVTLGI